MNIIRSITNINKKGSISNNVRTKNFEKFKDLFSCFYDGNPLKIVDLGGTQEYWEMMNFTDPQLLKVILINITNIKTTLPNFKSIKMDALDVNFDEYDIIFSHSLIEHLDRKEEFAKHIIDSGKPYFIQTPNKHFPIEPHYFIPFFQFFPMWLKIACKDLMVKGDEPHTINLLSKKDIKRLFPFAKIFEGKIYILTQSFIVFSTGYEQKK